MEISYWRDGDQFSGGSAGESLLWQQRWKFLCGRGRVGRAAMEVRGEEPGAIIPGGGGWDRLLRCLRRESLCARCVQRRVEVEVQDRGRETVCGQASAWSA